MGNITNSITSTVFIIAILFVIIYIIILFILYRWIFRVNRIVEELSCQRQLLTKIAEKFGINKDELENINNSIKYVIKNYEL